MVCVRACVCVLRYFRPCENIRPLLSWSSDTTARADPPGGLKNAPPPRATLLPLAAGYRERGQRIGNFLFSTVRPKLSGKRYRYWSFPVFRVVSSLKLILLDFVASTNHMLALAVCAAKAVVPESLTKCVLAKRGRGYVYVGGASEHDEQRATHLSHVGTEKRGDGCPGLFPLPSASMVSWVRHPPNDSHATNTAKRFLRSL